MSAEFCDTNVIVYAYDSTAGVKHVRAQALLERLWLEGNGALSVQVLQELFVTLTRKVARPVDHGDARAIVTDLATWSLVQPTASDVVAAIDATMRWKLSFWDAMILTAAQRAGAAVLWSEDFSDRQRFDAVTVRNPFATEHPGQDVGTRPGAFDGPDQVRDERLHLTPGAHVGLDASRETGG